MARNEHLPKVTNQMLRVFRSIAPEYKASDVFHSGALVYRDEEEPEKIIGFKTLKDQKKFGSTSSRAQLFAGREGDPQSRYSKEHNHGRKNSRRNPIF